jgi:TadE-like protein
MIAHPYKRWRAYVRAQARACARDRERGSVVLWFTITTPAVLLIIVLIVDGSAKIRAGEQADTYATEAARAAAIAIGPRPAGGAIDLQAATSAANTYLAAANATGEVTVTGPAMVSVTVHLSIIAPISGTRFTATRTAKAQLLVGVSTGQAP